MITLVACHDIGVDHVMTKRLQDLLAELAGARRRLEEADQAVEGQRELFAVDEPPIDIFTGGRELGRLIAARERCARELERLVAELVDQAVDEGAIR